MPQVIFCPTEPVKSQLIASWTGLDPMDQVQLTQMMERWREGPEGRVHYGWYDTQWIVLMQFADCATEKGLLMCGIFEHPQDLITITSCDSRGEKGALVDALHLIGYQSGPFTHNIDWKRLNKGFWK